MTAAFGAAPRSFPGRCVGPCPSCGWDLGGQKLAAILLLVLNVCAEPECLLAPCWVQYRPLPTADCWFFIFSLNSFIQSFLPTEDSGIF